MKMKTTMINSIHYVKRGKGYERELELFTARAMYLADFDYIFAKNTFISDEDTIETGLTHSLHC